MYNHTVWQDNLDVPGLEGFGFVIQKIVVHSGPTYASGEHYNMPKEEWDVRRLLEVMPHFLFFLFNIFNTVSSNM